MDACYRYPLPIHMFALHAYMQPYKLDWPFNIHMTTITFNCSPAASMFRMYIWKGLALINIHLALHLSLPVFIKLHLGIWIYVCIFCIYMCLPSMHIHCSALCAFCIPASPWLTSMLYIVCINFLYTWMSSIRSLNLTSLFYIMWTMFALSTAYAIRLFSASLSVCWVWQGNLPLVYMCVLCSYTAPIVYMWLFSAHDFNASHTWSVMSFLSLFHCSDLTLPYIFLTASMYLFSPVA